MRDGRYLILVVILFIIGAVIGWTLNSLYVQSQTAAVSGLVTGVGGGPGASTEPQENSVLSNFREQANSLLREHTVLAGEYVEKILDSEDPAVIKASIDKNSKSIADMMGNIYGGSASAQFLSLWNDQILEFSNYAKAVRSNNSSGKSSAMSSLDSIASNIQNTVNNLDSSNTAARMGEMMREHIALILSLADAYQVHNQPLVSQYESSAFDQAGNFADYIVQASVTAKPQMFK